MRTVLVYLLFSFLLKFCVVKTTNIPLEEIYEHLSIPDDAEGVLVFGQSSHNDYDWLNFFSTNVNNHPPDISGINYWVQNRQPSNTILTAAAEFLLNSTYGYSIAEVSFLRAFQELVPQKFAQLLDAGDRFEIMGGYTSPDNLLPSGESFIRNYLVSISWLNQFDVTWSNTVWIVDDFGHDSQLPVILRAMNTNGVAIARVPGSCHQGANIVPNDIVPAHNLLLDHDLGGLDFMWEANDGSSVFTFYEPTHYDTGDRVAEMDTSEYNSSSDAANCETSALPHDTIERFQCYLNVRQPVSTPIVFVTTGSDFAMPISNLPDAVETWNNLVFPNTKIWAVTSSFGHYTDLVKAWLIKNQGHLPVRKFHGHTPESTFISTPYWMGHYTSRPSLKILHYQSTRTLQTVELYLVISKILNLDSGITQEDIDQIWNDHVPSTHHDYITGTSTDSVYTLEQLPLSLRVYRKATSLRSRLLATFGEYFGNIRHTASETAPKVIVFNPHSFPVEGIAVIDTAISTSPNGMPPQTMDSEIVIYGSAPSLGYSVQTLSGVPHDLPPVELLMINDNLITFENGNLSATIDKQQNWGITYLVDKNLGENSILTAGNILEFRYDTGSIYRFGFEEGGCNFDKMRVTVTPSPAQVIEQTPLRVRVSADLHVSSSAGDTIYTLEYSLVIGEPYLRMKLSGSAQSFTTVLTKFNFNESISYYEHGTPYHWDHKEPFPYGVKPDFQMTFEAVHDFIIPQNDQGTILGAIYHSATPAWGVIGNTLYGALLRNTPDTCGFKGAAGSDSHNYEIHYAIRVPSGLHSASTGQPLKEARVYQTPLRALFLDQLHTTPIPSNYSLVRVTDPPSVIISTVKWGTLDPEKVFMRFYCPENHLVDVGMVVDENLGKIVRLSSALEEPDGSVVCEDCTTLDFIAQYALSTLSFEQN